MSNKIMTLQPEDTEESKSDHAKGASQTHLLGVGPVRDRERSPAASQSNLTFLSGTGVFDWYQSKLMEDV